MEKEWPSLMRDALDVAVPLWMHDFKGLSFEERHRIATEASQVIASQGDTLQYGSKAATWGHGAREAARCKARLRCAASDCRCGGNGCADTACYCHLRGEPSYSAGEVFNFLAKGLACLAYQPGGVTFAGQHWCANHQECIDAQERRTG